MRLILLSGQTHIINIRTSLFLILNLVDFTATAIMINLGFGFEGNILLGTSPHMIGLVKLMVSLAVVRFLGNRIGMMRFLNIGMGLVATWNITWLLIMLGGIK